MVVSDGLVVAEVDVRVGRLNKLITVVPEVLEVSRVDIVGYLLT
jgi:hypothetical protein